MKLKFSIFILLSLCKQTLFYAQTSPVKWINNSYNINVDTCSKNSSGYCNNYNDFDVLRFAFKNIGEHVTFIDTTDYCHQYVTKSNDTSTILLSPKIDYTNLLKKRDTTISVSLPFYYEGKIYVEKLTYNLTFGKSKLIAYDKLHVDATNQVAQSVKNDTIHEYPEAYFTHYFTLKNISKKTIYCTKEFLSYDDSNSLDYYTKGKYFKILPGQTYKIPAVMKMGRRHRFNRAGWIEVFSEDIREVFSCEINSKFELKGK